MTLPMKTIRCVLLFLALSLMPGISRAGSLFEMESAYLGDGWFRYRIKTLGDPLFSALDLTSFGVPFTNRVEYGAAPSLWLEAGAESHRVDWIYDSFNAQNPGYEVTFTARSAERNFRTVTTNVLGYSFLFNGGNPGGPPVSAAGVAAFPVLVPCPPAQADGSPPTRTAGFEALPPLKIDRLVTEGSQVRGLVFSWVGDFTVRLQATTNLTEWREVARLFGTGASNLWTTNQPLNARGNFFRLQLVGQGHIPP